jgi:hypothetical protein
MGSFVRTHAPGLALAGLFFVAYLYLGLQLNSPRVDTTDNFLDADNYTWMRRIAWEDGGRLEMRGPHPFAFLILRPLGWTLNLLFQEPFLSALLLNTLAGGLCVYLAWVFIGQQTQNPTYAILIAGLLGISTSHLWFGAIIESYIFSAAALLAGFVLLQRRRESIRSVSVAALITFGLTLTNVVQSFIGFAVARPRAREIISFAAVVLALGLVFSLLQAVWYPSSVLFFGPDGARTEQEFSISILQEPAWRAAGRATLLVRTVLLYAVIAPRPFVFTDEVGGTFPRFNFFRIAPGEYAFSSYDGLGQALVIVWAALLLVAAYRFVRKLAQTRRADFALAFLLCVVFNLLLHVGYGYEPFLYSPDWTYALVIFVGLAVVDFAGSRWFQAGLLVFIMGLAWNQAQFLGGVIETVRPFMR